jgi:hypothetical protein
MAQMSVILHEQKSMKWSQDAFCTQKPLFSLIIPPATHLLEWSTELCVEIPRQKLDYYASVCHINIPITLAKMDLYSQNRYEHF